jgi:hypothetical protein
MLRMFRAGFVRHFLSGFAIGAVGLVAIQVSRPEAQPLYPPVAQAEPAPSVS